MEREGRDGYRDQIVTCDVGVSLHSKTHPLFMKYSNMMAQAHSGTHITIQACFLCFFYNPYMSLFNFSFTCLHSFFTCLKQMACLLLLRQPRFEFSNVGLCTQRTNEMCVPFCNSLTAVHILALRMFSHANLPWSGSCS